MRTDEFWNTFHFAPFVVEYFIDQRVPVIAPWQVAPDDLLRSPFLEDGDAILHVAERTYGTTTVPPGGVPPVELWRIRRMPFVRDGERLVAPADSSMSFELRTAGNGEQTIEPGQNLGRWSVLAWLAGQDAPSWLADVTLQAGRAVSLGPASAGSELERLVLADVEREVIR
jgi:hypothetical protein